MSPLFWGSYVALWLFAAASLVVWYALLRQVGVLHERVGPRGAALPHEGPDVGAEVEPFALSSASGDTVLVPAPEGRTVLVLSSQNCETCEALAPAVAALMRRPIPEYGVVELLVQDVPPDELMAYALKHDLAPDRVVAGTEPADRLGVAITPLALVLDHYGHVLAKGVPNTLEQLELLIEESRQLEWIPPDGDAPEAAPEIAVLQSNAR